jgi:hypothetical protein
MRLWIALGIAGLLAVGAAVAGIGLACSSLIGGASEQLGEGLEFAQDELEREQRQSSITHERFASVRPGVARAELEKRLGRPVDVGGSEPGARGGVSAGAACIYYNERGQPLLAGPTYRFCFRGGRLVAKDVL